MSLKTKTIYTENGSDFKETIVFQDLSDQQKSGAKALLESYLRPLPEKTINQGIARLQVVCPEREKSDIDRKFRAKIYLDELGKYPADIVMAALKQRYKWFPSLAELLEYCENKMAFRRLVEKGLRR